MSKYTLSDYGDCQLYGFYATLALEAFQYEAETGSIRAIEWVLQCAGGLDLLKDAIHRYEILVTIGITFYNFARDANFRYGISNVAQTKFDEQHQLYQGLVKQFVEDCPSYMIMELFKNRLNFLVDLVYVAFVTSTRIRDEKHHSDAMQKVKKYILIARQEKDTFPKLLLGLFEYQAAKLDYSRQLDRTPDYNKIFGHFSKAIQHLSQYKDNEHSVATYYYDVVYGELNSGIMFCLDN